MTELIPGKQYRFTITGRAHLSGVTFSSGRTIPASWLTGADTVELLPDPLPTTPGSVILDADRWAWQLSDEGWRNTFNGLLGTIFGTGGKPKNPVTVLFDAGADT